MSEEKKVPKRRFREFRDAPAWEERKLGDLANHRGGTAIEKYFDKNGKYKVISIGSYGLNNKYIDQNIRAISNEITDDRVVHSGELTMVLNDKTSNGTIIGRSILIEVDNKYVINQRTEIISPKTNFNANFAYIVLNGTFRNKVRKIVQGGTQIYVNYPAVEKLTMHVPNNAEQIKIGEFFRQLNFLITLQQRKLDKLKNLKKAYLNEMFPAEGENVPKRRFPGFTGAWEKQKFGNLFSTLKSNTFSRSELTSNSTLGAIRDIHYGDILIKFNECLDITKDRLPYIIDMPKTSERMNSYLKNGDIVIADTAEDETAGKAVEVINLTNQKVVSGLHTMPFRPNKKFSSGYLGFYLNSKAYHDQLIPLMQGIKVTSISKSKIKDTCITFPTSLAEQEKISKSFLNLDHLITLQQRKLNKLKNLKKAYLNEMFV